MTIGYLTMKTRVISLLLMLVMIRGSVSYCQSDSLQEQSGSRFSLGGSFGVSDAHQLDNYLSPFVFDGVHFASKISFLIESGRSRHTIEAFYSQGPLSSDPQPRDVTQHVGYFSYSYVYSLAAPKPGEDGVRFSLGGGISSFVMQTDFNTTDETHYTTYDQSWYWAHSVNLVCSGGYEFSARKYISLRVTIPIALLVSRPANERWMNSNNAAVSDNFAKAATQGSMEYAWDSFDLFADLEFRYPLGGDFDILATYRFGYVSSSKPASILSMGMYMNTYLAGILWSF